MILAKTAIEQTKRSSGMLTGMGLALTCYLLPLVGTINLFVNWLAMPTPLVSLVITVVTAGGSIVYMMYEIRSARLHMTKGFLHQEIPGNIFQLGE